VKLRSHQLSADFNNQYNLLKILKLGGGVIFCYAIIRNKNGKSAVYFLDTALSNYRGPTICRDHPILSIVVQSALDHRFFGVSNFFDHSNESVLLKFLKSCDIAFISVKLRNRDSIY
jgi:hypothetical protein